MILVRLLRWLFGYVTFRGTGDFPERFMNLCAREEINLWEVHCRNGVLYACARWQERLGCGLRYKKDAAFLFVLRNTGGGRGCWWEQ